MTDEEIKTIASKLIKDIAKNFKSQLKLKDIDEKYEKQIDFDLAQNKEKGYIGSFFDVTGNSIDLTIWAGYDNATEHFCISFYSEKYKEQLVSALEGLHLNYYAEYIAFDNDYWHSIFIDTKYKNNKNREFKNSTNEIDFSSLEQDIKNILKKFKRNIDMKNKLTRKWPLVWLNITSNVIICDILVFIWLENKLDIYSLIILGISLVAPVVLSIFYYMSIRKLSKLKLLEKVVNDENLKTISQDKIITEKNNNQSSADPVIEKKDSTTYDSKSKVLISAIEAIKDL